MKKLITVFALTVLSITAHAQEVDFITIITDSLVSANGKAEKPYEFYYDDKSILWGKKGTEIADLKHVSIKNRATINVEGVEIEYFIGKYGMTFFVDRLNNKFTVLFNSGSTFVFY
tara:strand:- start:5013 stop:5360 length:348 start_codon:yes stop_codon:yes gene_type:complete